MELNQKIFDAASKLMENKAKDYLWYTDTPEQPFEFTPGSIWLINPDTKEWMLELKKSGVLWYYYKTRNTFSMYLNMEYSDFQSFIKIWVEDVLKRGVVSTPDGQTHLACTVEDVLKRGVVLTDAVLTTQACLVEDVIKNGKQWN
jgi:hypothetical protein